VRCDVSSENCQHLGARELPSLVHQKRVYGGMHTPSKVVVNVTGFSGPLEAKVWLTTGAFTFALLQLVSALVMYGKVPGVRGPAWIGGLHRWSGRAAVGTGGGAAAVLQPGADGEFGRVVAGAAVRGDGQHDLTSPGPGQQAGIDVVVAHDPDDPSLLGKLCTGSQLLTVGVVLLLNALDSSFPAVMILFVLTLVLTVASAFHYVYMASFRGAGTEP